MAREDDASSRPLVRVGAGKSRRWRRGFPWLFSNEIDMTAETRALPCGSLVTVVDAGEERLGVATFNPHSLIAARLLDRDSATRIDAAFLVERLRRAMALRAVLTDARFYRLVHAEADGLPGLVVDRYDDVVTIQANTAGMESLLPEVLEALDQALAPATVVLRNESAFRTLEGLSQYVRVAKGVVSGPVMVHENGCTFQADLLHGQKTGWFYDQRDNRAFVASLARGRRVMDVYAYLGGFTIPAAKAGAEMVLAIDRSAEALALAEDAAEANGVRNRCRFYCGEAFAELSRRLARGERYELVVCDPPAFVKNRKDLASGRKGYRKLVRLAAGLVAPGGFLFVASCSHHVSPEIFAEEVSHGLLQAGRSARVLRAAGAGPDHPVHPALPESAYLKTMVLQVD